MSYNLIGRVNGINILFDTTAESNDYLYRCRGPVTRSMAVTMDPIFWDFATGKKTNLDGSDYVHPNVQYETKFYIVGTTDSEKAKNDILKFDERYSKEAS